jgi:hypothetical protein
MRTNPKRRSPVAPRSIKEMLKFLNSARTLEERLNALAFVASGYVEDPGDPEPLPPVESAHVAADSIGIQCSATESPTTSVPQLHTSLKPSVPMNRQWGRQASRSSDRHQFRQPVRRI